MTCVIFGCGLVGSFLGAAAGADLAISHHPGPISAETLLPSGAIRIWRPRPITSLAGADPAMPVLIATRVHQTPWSSLPRDAMAAQNGLGQPRPVITCFMALDRGPGQRLHATGPTPRLVMGPPGRAWEGVLAAWTLAGIAIEIHTDPRPWQWEKTILNATVGPLCLATGLTMAEVWSQPDLRMLALEATREGAAVAEAEGISPLTGIVDRAAAFFSLVGAHRPSLLSDPGELPWVLGHLRHKGHGHGLPCPALDRIAGLVAEAASTQAPGPTHRPGHPGRPGTTAVESPS